MMPSIPADASKLVPMWRTSWNSINTAAIASTPMVT